MNGGAPDFAIVLLNTTSVDANDFIFVRRRPASLRQHRFSDLGDERAMDRSTLVTHDYYLSDEA